MPRYEYECENCQKRFEIEATIKEKDKGLNTDCPFCKSKKTTRVFTNICTISKNANNDKHGCSGCNSNENEDCSNCDTEDMPPGCCH